MFDQILDIVRQHLGGDPQVASAIPPAKADEVHEEVAKQITTGLTNHAAAPGNGVGGLLSSLQQSVTSGGTLTSAIEGGLVSTLANKFGLPPLVTGAIAGALPGILQKFAQKAADPTDQSVTAESITQSLSKGMGGLGKLFG